MASIKNAVDKLGQIKADIADLKIVEGLLRQQLIDAELPEIDGKLFRATVNTHDRVCIDYECVIDHLPKTALLKKLVKQYTSKSEVTTVKVVARTTQRIAASK